MNQEEPVNVLLDAICGGQIQESMSALAAHDPTIGDEYGDGSPFDREVVGQHAHMTPSKNGEWLRRDMVIAAAARADEQIAHLQQTVIRLRNETDHAERVYRENSQSYRDEIAALRATISIDAAAIRDRVRNLEWDNWLGSPFATTSFGTHYRIEGSTTAPERFCVLYSGEAEPWPDADYCHASIEEARAAAQADHAARVLVNLKPDLLQDLG